MAKWALGIEQSGSKLYNIQNMTGFWVFSGQLKTFKSNNHLQKTPKSVLPCYNPKKGPKKQSDFEYCSVLTHSASFLGLVWSFFGNITCLRELFGDFRGNLLISGVMLVFQHIALTRNFSKRSQILNIVQFWPVLLKSECSYGHFLEIKHV